jgi:hypothetical protein
MAKKKSRTSRRQRFSNTENEVDTISDQYQSMSLNEVDNRPDEPFYDTLYNFLENPNRYTVMNLNNDDIKILDVIAKRVDRDVVQDINIEFKNGKTIVINSKLSKQILNYINGFRVKCNFGKCETFKTSDIWSPYNENSFFSKEECMDNCGGLSLDVIPSNVLDMISVQYLDNIVLNDRGLFLSKSKLPIQQHQFHLVNKITVDIDSRYTTLDFNFFNNFPNLTHLNFEDYFNEPIELSLEKLTHLEFGYFFDQNIDNLVLPSLLYLRFGDEFNKPVDNVNNFTKLKILKFGEKFNHPIQLYLQDLIYVKFGSRFNRPVVLQLPELTHLRFGENFDQPIHRDDLVLPKLSALEFGNFFNRPLDGLDFSSVVQFHAGENFEQPLDNVNFSSLKYLVLDNYALYREIYEYERYGRLLEYNPTFGSLSELHYGPN